MSEAQSEVFSHGHHRWKFFRAGGLDQVMFRNGQDIARLADLDQKLWIVLSCPTRGVFFDPRTLDLIDADQDKRIRVPELLAAVQWTTSLLKDPDSLMHGAAALPLAEINDASPMGARILATARRILANVGKPDAQAITLADISARIDALTKMRLNGDGVVPAASADDAETQQAIREIVACMGGEKDRSGSLGATLAQTTAFFEACEAYAAWWAKAAADPAVLPLGTQTGAAAAAWGAVRTKVDDFFARCRLVKFNALASTPLNSGEADFAGLAQQDLSLTSPAIARLPLAAIAPDQSLLLSEGVNPYWASALAAFRSQVAEPLLNRKTDALCEADWRVVCALLAPHEAWQACKAGGVVESLGLERVRTLLASNVHARVEALIRLDSEQDGEHTLTESVEKLILLHRDLLRLLNNFVSFSDFYDPKLVEIFHVGRLYMAARFCDLCVHVDDIDRHAMMATASKLFLAYCELTYPPTGEKRNICAAVTSGFAETLWVGRNGIFYDREGRCWEAVLVKVVDGPISLKEAFWAPWKKISMMINEQIRKLVAARHEAAMAAAARSAEQTVARAAGAPPPPPPPPPKMDGAAMASSVAAVGIAVGLLGSAVGGLVATLSNLPVWKSLLGVVFVILAVSGPSVILAYFKLRSRDLAPVLNACRWAVNRRIRMTMLLGRVFTQEAHLPEGAERQLTDPYADKNKTRNTLIIVLIALGVVFALWALNLFNKWLPDVLRHGPAPAPALAVPGTNTASQAATTVKGGMP
ncbi:MAG: hypothetical protein WCI17_10905 [bacterium]